MANKKALEIAEGLRDQVEELVTALGGEEGGVSLPESLEEINELEKAEVTKLATELHLDIEGKKIADVKELLCSVHKIVNGNEEEIEDEDLKALALAVGISVKKLKTDQIVKELQEYFEVSDDSDAKDKGDDDEEEKEEEEEESEDEEDDEEKPKSKKKKDDDDEEESEEEDDEEEKDADEEDSESEDDGIDRASIAKKFKKFPKDTVMKSRLELYNKHASKSEKIETKKAKIQDAYRKLVERMIDKDGEIAEWGKPYIANNEGMCCGLTLEEGDEDNQGKCLITGKVFEIDDDQEFSEVAESEDEEEEEKEEESGDEEDDEKPKSKKKSSDDDEEEEEEDEEDDE